MKVRDIITKLMQYNMDAEFRVFVNNNLIKDFGFSFGSTAGITESLSTDVNLEIDYRSLEKIETDPVAEAQSEAVNHTPSPRAANVGSNVTSGKGNWFTGTSWGN
jgi:hypothetical protein